METSSVEAPTAAEKETQTQQEPVEVPILTRCTKVERKELIPSEEGEKKIQWVGELGDPLFFNIEKNKITLQVYFLYVTTLYECHIKSHYNFRAERFVRK